ncbi:MAG: methyltransferase domain-containing protein [Promethearchaeota archaeon]
MVKLNLGCGVYYKPGYVNIDNKEQIADELLDIAHLPHENNSVDEIEASHILEHFDVITVPFLLAEWFRVLKPGATLYIEAPHFRKQALKILFTQNDGRRSDSAMRFFFGVNLPGNSHKVGLTPKYLKHQFESIGFQNVKRHRPQSFKTERSFRLSAQKPMTTSLLTKTGFITTFRSKIFNHFKEFDVLFLDTVEKNCLSLIRDLFIQDNRAFFTTPRIISTAAKCALIHPQLARFFLELMPEVRIRQLHIDILGFLETHASPGKFLALWMKWKKDPQNSYVSFLQFQEYWEKKLSRFFQEGVKSSDSLRYFEHLTGEPCEYFAFELIELHVLKITNLGIKTFAHGQYSEAVTHFLHATRFNPGCVLCYWNLARLTLVMNGKKAKSEARKWYHQALLHIHDRKLSRTITTELNFVTAGQSDHIEKIPIQIRT